MGWTNVTIKPAFFSMGTKMSAKLMYARVGLRIQSAPPRQTKTMEELFPAPDRFINYSNALDTIPEPPVPTLAVPLVEDLISSQEFISAENPIAWMKQKLMINEQEIQQIACLTTGQKENCMWSSVRKNRLTASNFGCVLAAIKRNRYPVSLYKRLCSAYDLSKKDAIIWGTCDEKVAIEKYRTFGDAVVEPTGIWLHCNGVLGSSPDGLIRRPAAFGFSYQNPGLADTLEMSNVKPEILEVKCPFSAKNMTIPEAIEKVHDFCLGNNSVGSGF
ncbi:uncharacterized protein LOC134245490 isoform X2 [Saccostrea cucullata]|uniref:uncharacterized protein LOC134245490 isoform X2 n=1 Tax=Saccostrea cuccullata TaxID=36930 RepID=UPI002ED50B20